MTYCLGSRRSACSTSIFCVADPAGICWRYVRGQASIARLVAMKNSPLSDGPTPGKHRLPSAQLWISMSLFFRVSRQISKTFPDADNIQVFIRLVIYYWHRNENRYNFLSNNAYEILATSAIWLCYYDWMPPYILIVLLYNSDVFNIVY